MEAKLDKKLKSFTFRHFPVSDMFTTTIKSTGNSAKAGCPKKYEGRKAVILILPESAEVGSDV